MAKTKSIVRQLRIVTPADHRAILMHAIEALMERRMSVPAANAVASLSAEVHKSINAEWEYRRYLAEEVAFDDARLLMLPMIDGTAERE